MEFIGYVLLLRSRWPIILGASLLGVAVGLALSLSQVPRYVSTAKVFVSTSAVASISDLNQGGTFTTQIVQSYADVALSPIVLDKVRSSLHLKESTNQLAGDVTATAPASTVVLQISATSTSPREAAQIANEVVRNLQLVVLRLTPGLSNQQSAIKLTQIQQAVPSATPVTPRSGLNAALGFLVGLIAGCTLVVVRRALDTRVRAPADVIEATGLPVLGVLPRTADRSRPLTFVSRPHSVEAEAYRTIRTALRYVDMRATGALITITSSIEGEGKSTTSANLSLALADAGARVLYVDADLRRPSLHSFFGVDNGVGLTDVIVDLESLDKAVQSHSDTPLDLLPSGPIPPNPSELLQSSRMGRFLDEARKRYDVVIFDVPPLLPVTDAAVLAVQTDGTVLVAGCGEVSKHQLIAASQILERVGVRPLGAVVTKQRSDRTRTYSYSYSYTQGEQALARLSTNAE